MRERVRRCGPILREMGSTDIAVIYWVAYQKGSFSLKERYHCPEQARSRCSDLITEARYIRLIPAPEEPPALTHCFELPPVRQAAPPPVSQSLINSLRAHG